MPLPSPSVPYPVQARHAACQLNSTIINKKNSPSSLTALHLALRIADRELFAKQRTKLAVHDQHGFVFYIVYIASTLGEERDREKEREMGGEGEGKRYRGRGRREGAGGRRGQEGGGDRGRREGEEGRGDRRRGGGGEGQGQRKEGEERGRGRRKDKRREV